LGSKRTERGGSRGESGVTGARSIRGRPCETTMDWEHESSTVSKIVKKGGVNKEYREKRGASREQNRETINVRRKEAGSHVSNREKVL